MTAPAAPAPGFYADPLDPAGQRWWDGSAWTETVRPAVAEEDLPAEPVVDEFVTDEFDESNPDSVPGLAPDPLPASGLPVERATTAAELATQPLVTVPPGLYPDPYGQAALRRWDGTQWTTETSDGLPFEPEPPAAESVPAVDPPAFPTRSDVLPPSRRPGGGWARPTRSRRPSTRVLAAAAVVVLSVGVRVFFLLDDDGPAPAPSQVAQTINLRAGDLPRGWTPQDASTPDADPGESALSGSNDTGPALARCLGAPDPVKAEVYSATSPTYTSGAAEVSSDVTVVRDAGTAAADLRAMRGPKVASCISTVANPALKKALAARGITLSGFTVKRLPDVPANGYAMRLTWTMTARGRSMPLHSDVYGFARGAVEVELTSTKAGATPDPKLGRQMLQLLQTRAAHIG